MTETNAVATGEAGVSRVTVDTVSVYSEDIQSLHHLRWTMAVRQYVSVDLFKYVQFVNRDEDIQYGSDIQKIICKTCNIPEEERQGYWESCGRDEVLEVMGRRRQAVAASIKMRFGKLMRKKGTKLPEPGLFVWLDIDEESSPQSSPQRSATRGLREAPGDHYLWFCENFMDCVIPTVEWKLQSKKKLLSEYVQAPLETFAVLLYKNGYNKWTETFRPKDDDGTELSSLSNSSQVKASFLYTGDSRGSRRYEGWNNDGMTFYNETLVQINLQRGNPGSRFEHTLLKRLTEVHRRAPNNNDEPNRAPRATNSIGDLMRIVGV